MIDSLQHPWNPKQSVLFQHMHTKEIDSQSFTKIKELLLEQIQQDEEFAFLKNHPVFQEYIQ